MSKKITWQKLADFEDIFDFYKGIAKITINRPRYRNAFRPQTVNDMIKAMVIAREDTKICCVVVVYGIWRSKLF